MGVLSTSRQRTGGRYTPLIQSRFAPGSSPQANDLGLLEHEQPVGHPHKRLCLKMLCRSACSFDGMADNVLDDLYPRLF